MFDFDVVIIGAGVTGCAIARELSRYDLHIGVLEKEEDVCSGTSKANSAIVHAGFDAEPGKLKAKFNVEGSRMMAALSEELDFDYKQNGSLVLCFAEEELPELKKLYERGIENGVEGLKLLTGDEARQMEPNVTDHVVGALYAPTGAIVCPFGLTIALAENACDNGVEFKFLTKIEDIRPVGMKTEDGIQKEITENTFVKEAGYELYTNHGIITTKYVINAAGVYADEIHNMVSEEKLHITPRKGDYCLLDKEAGKHVSHTIFQLPGKLGKGILVSPTVHGNLLTGPTAVNLGDDEKELTATTAEELADVMGKAAISVKNIPFRQVITSFSGLRAHEDGNDFVIGEVKDAEGFFDAAGIESPGLSSAPAVGVYLAEMVAEKAGADRKENWNGKRKGIVRPNELSFDERAALIKENPAYGNIICRCEGVSEGEIVDAITRTLGASSLDGIKRRVRQGMGRCQAGFCTPKTMEILAREKNLKMEEICKNVPGSELLMW